MQEKKCTLEQAMKVHEAFRPMLLSKILSDTLDHITLHKKERDDAQKERLELALKILEIKGVDFPAYPNRTHESLLAQMKKQLDKIVKKKDKSKKKKKEKTEQ
eukprot:382904_1